MTTLPLLLSAILAQAEHAGEAAAAVAERHGTEIAQAAHVSWLWLIPFFPLLGSAINTAFGPRLQKRYGKRAAHTVAVGAMVLSCIVAEVAFWKMFATPEHERFFEDHLWTMWQSGTLKVDLSFGVDPLGMLMTMIVTHVATLIHIYSTGYMADEPAYWRFFLWLNLFVFSMLLLVMGSNFVVMFFGWEGVGLCSYGLIAFWYTDIEKAKAGLKAFVVNRFGDFGFVIGLFILFWSLSGSWQDNRYVPDPGLANQKVLGAPAPAPRVSPAGVQLGPTMEFRELRNQISDESSGMSERLRDLTLWGMPVIALICIGFFIGATGKSAQIPLYVWLPDAMAGPTPVSALIHAATMVTAGVYMVARLNFLFALSPLAMTVVATVGCLTAIFAASIGFFQYDIKKVLAYSTVSQLGFMFIGVGVGAYWAGIFHLMTHAFFKACLFLGSGSVILACHHEQDMRKMGGLAKYTPITRWTYLAACWAIAGFPFASGFYSKDEILWKAWTAGGLSTPWIGHAIYVVGAIAALGTSFYMFRSYYMTFTGEYRGGHGHEDKERLEDPHAMAAHQHAAAAVTAPNDFAATADVVAATVPHQHGPDHAHDTHVHEDAHGGVPHESPNSMTWVLAALAFAAVVSGIIFGLPALWSGHEPLLEKFLAPSLPAAEKVPFAPASHSEELLFQFLGVAIAALGWITARTLYVDAKSQVPARLKESFARAWAVVYNKYYVDELYGATVIRFSLFLSRVLYWIDQNVIDSFVNFMGWVGRSVAYVDAAFDNYVVDGAVNGLADLIMNGGRTLRRVQTGHIQAYLFGALGGAIVFVILQYVIR
ncbi:MAG: NADH-quinone oxidoreductase subunit L [Deltaproteobacteria bacterium]|nr:MAG: NADH-quinone oxidoreductase subunit L [Deltaproteobacteria bacterium]